MLGKRLTVLILFALASAVIASGFVSGPTSMFTLEWPEGDGIERDSPGDHITEDQIHVYEDRVVIELDDAKWAKFTDTDSMDPVLDTDANALQIVPKEPDAIAVGDIISYTLGDRTIIHRVYDIGVDENGWYAITKGDNVRKPDPEPVRFNQVSKLVVGILY